MAINSYSTLKTAISKWLLKDSGDSYFTSAMLDDIIFLAEAELSRRLRVRQMREQTTLTTVANTSNVTAPTGFLEVYTMYFNDGISPQEIRFADAGYFARNNLYNQTGEPSYFYVDEDSFIFGAKPASVYTIALDYYKAIPNLSDSQTTNKVLTTYPDLYLAACLKQAYGASQDAEREAVYELRLDKLIMQVNKADKGTIAAKGTRGVARQII